MSKYDVSTQNGVIRVSGDEIDYETTEGVLSILNDGEEVAAFNGWLTVVKLPDDPTPTP